MVYIVEDSHAIADLIRQYLDRRGYDCAIIPSGEEMLRRLNNMEPARLIILDMKLNGVNGNDILEIMWTTGSEIPVIVLTGGQDKIDDRYREIVKAVFAKPPRFPLLLEAVQTHILTIRERRQGLNSVVRFFATAGDILTENRKALAIILPIVAAAAAAIAAYLGIGPKGR